MLINRGMIPSAAQNHGAILVEAAIILPLFLALLFGIYDIGKALSDNLLIGQIHYQAGRAGALAESNCVLTAQQHFRDRLTLFGIPTANVDMSASASTTLASGVRGLNLSVVVPSRCVFCTMFTRVGNTLSYHAGTFYAYENNSACS
jgi:hypothetical protein